MSDRAEPERITLDDAVAAVREDAPAAGVAEEAASRVFERIAPRMAAAGATATIEGCADVRALLPAHRRQELGSARALLVDDHLRECVACRAAFLSPGQRRLALLPWRPAAATSRASAAWPPYAAAASVTLATVCAWAVYQFFLAVPPGSRAAVQSVTGTLQRVAEEQAPALAPGEEIGEREPVRTGRTSRALLRLRDGSLVEMGERSELSVSAQGADTTIRLSRGSIIVQAAKQRGGHLRVASGEANVRVTGTVFAVSRGLRGSRVSVLEGEVRVAASGSEQALTPGQQWTSSETVERVPLREEVAWSGDASSHLALLAELKVLRERWSTVRLPGLRYESRLLPLLPAEALVVGSLPNYGETLADAHRLFQERLQESALLREWWSRADPSRHGAPSLAAVIEAVRAFGEFLGDEVMVAAVHEPDRHRAVPLLVAEVRRPGLAEFLAGELSRLAPGEDGAPKLRILDGTAENIPGSEPELLVLVRDGVMAVSVDAALLRGLETRLGAPGGGLAGTPFGARLAQGYEDGVGLLFAADLERVRAAAASTPGADPGRAELMARTGLDALQYLVLERKQVAEAARTQAVLTFTGPPRGVPAWLAPPAPMGSLEFVSPGAQAVAAFVVKSPALILDEVVTWAAVAHGGARAELAELEQELALHVREDLAETLGGELALALDGPVLPTPAWKVVVEVYDPGRLQASIQTL
ncbi:MAG TPA: FecR domain-containing protein, partial [Vicinamibacteria bacterium]|nr:FecR domain-containing protein [Vicinamibacteria bacterium]